MNTEAKELLMTDLLKLSIMRAIIPQFKGARIAVLGDPMLDYYHFGHVERLSPEGPWPIFIEDEVEIRDGGAGNVVANLRALGCEPLPCFPPAPYTMKHRYMVGSHCLFRHDRDRDHSEQKGEFDALHVRDNGSPRALVISDYDKGWCSFARCQRNIEFAQAEGMPVIVDPKGTDWDKYRGATVICPNEQEWQSVNCQQPAGIAIVAKHGSKGMALIERDEAGTQIARLFPACARQVFDVTGAGDTVTAVMAAALAVRAELPIAAELANIAAGVAVGHIGTYAVSAAELLAAL